jgi:hypothetical protein
MIWITIVKLLLILISAFGLTFLGCWILDICFKKFTKKNEKKSD